MPVDDDLLQSVPANEDIALIWTVADGKYLEMIATVLFELIDLTKRDEVAAHKKYLGFDLEIE